jgi:hypothetical protein
MSNVVRVVAAAAGVVLIVGMLRERGGDVDRDSGHKRPWRPTVAQAASEARRRGRASYRSLQAAWSARIARGRLRGARAPAVTLRS